MHIGSKILSKLIYSFELPIPSSTDIIRNTELSRILFGSILVYRYISTAWWVAPAFQDPWLEWNAIAALILGIAVTLGILTPICLLIFILWFFISPPFAKNLGDQIAIIVSWGLIFLGSGKHYSIDSFFLFPKRAGAHTKRKFSQFYKIVYRFAADPTQRNLTYIRFIMALLYWGVLFCAMYFHLQERYWQSGELLKVMLTAPYFSHFYSLIIQINTTYPVLFHWFCKLGLYIQQAWELLFLPLLFFRWGRILALIQGLIFILSAIFLINLGGALGLSELVLIFLLFGYPSVFSKTKKKESTQKQDLHQKNSKDLIYLSQVSVCMVICFLCISAAAILFGQSWAYSILNGTVSAKIFRAFGLTPANVFNHDEVESCTDYFVIFEVNKQGEIQRLVPYLDTQGGRMSYLKDDYIFYHVSLPWHRSSQASKVHEGMSTELTEFSKQTIQSIIQLDSYRMGYSFPHYYRTELFRRTLINENGGTKWSDPKKLVTALFKFNPENLQVSFFGIEPIHHSLLQK